MERLPLGHSLAQLAAALRIGRWDVVFVMAEVADDETSGTQDWGGISRNTRQAHKRPVNKAGVNVSWCWKKEKNPTKIKKRTYLSAGCGQNNRNTLQQDPGADIWSLRLRDGHFPCHKWNVGSFETCIQAPPPAMLHNFAVFATNHTRLHTYTTDTVVAQVPGASVANTRFM